MGKSTNSLKKIEKRLHKQSDKLFGLKKWSFLGDMHKGHLIIVVHATERK